MELDTNTITRARVDKLYANTEHVHPILAEQQEEVHGKVRAGAKRAEDELAFEVRLEGLQVLAKPTMSKPLSCLCMPRGPPRPDPAKHVGRNVNKARNKK